MIAQGVLLFFFCVLGPNGSWCSAKLSFFSHAIIQSSKIPHRLKNDSLQASTSLVSGRFSTECVTQCVTECVTECVIVEGRIG